MSYDVAVWEGDPPADDAAALKTYNELWERYEGFGEPPSRRVLDFVGELTATYPDLDDLPEDECDDSPWAADPTGDALGPFLYLTLVPGKADATIPLIAETARRHGLACFDPQTAHLLATAGGPPGRPPLPARLRAIGPALSPHVLGATLAGIASALLTHWASWGRAALTGAAFGACWLGFPAARARFRRRA